MCSLHHKLFDSGAFTIDHHHILHVSELVNGSAGFEEWLMRFHGNPIRKPVRLSYAPGLESVDWHVREVFKGYVREVI
jgi:putative restriction endonuclease